MKTSASEELNICTSIISIAEKLDGEKLRKRVATGRRYLKRYLSECAVERMKFKLSGPYVDLPMVCELMQSEHDKIRSVGDGELEATDSS